MKKILTASLVSLCLINPVFASDDKPSKIAVINIERILGDSLAAKSVREQLDKKRAEYQADIDKKEADLNKRNTELSKQQSVLAQEAFEEKVREFNNKVSEVQKEFQTKKSALDQASMEALDKIETVVNEIVQAQAKTNDLSLVIPSSQVMFYKPELDISDVVLKSLNEKLKKVDVKITPQNSTSSATDKKK